MYLQAKEYFRSPADNVALELRAPQDPFPEHTHEFGEIVVISQGGGLHVVNDHASRVCAGSVLYLRPQDSHSFGDVSNLHLANVIYRLPERYEHLVEPHCDAFAGRPDWQIGIQTRAQVNQLLEQLADDSPGSDPTRACYREGIFLQLIAILWKARYCAQPQSSIEDRTRQLITFLRGNFAEPIDWQEISVQFSLSLRTLHRKLKEQTGMTPQRHLNQLRLEHAAHCLKYTTDSVTDIAFSCGFEDSNYFSTLFRKEFGQSPSEYCSANRSLLTKKA